MSRFECLQCYTKFPESRAVIVPYCGMFEYQCPECRSPHVEEFADDPIVKSIPPITVRPVSTANLEAEARRVLERMSNKETV